MSKTKKKNAVNFMVETTDDISRTLIIWATNELKTPTKPFIDELYLLCAAMLSNNYLVWRQMKPDANSDISSFIDLLFTHVFEEYRVKFPFRSEKQNLDEFLSEIHERMDAYTINIATALREEVNNIAVELEKYRREDCSSDDPHMQYMHALTTAEHPLKDAIIQSFFHIDRKDEKTLGDYGDFASQASSLLIRYDDIFREGLKRL
jgi:hypothetical protein